MPGIRLLAGLAGLSLVAAACGGGSATSTTPLPVVRSPNVQSAPAGCGRAVTTGTATLPVAVAGQPERTVIVHVPAGYRTGTRTALVLNMHGSNGSATQQEAFSGMDAASERYGFIVGYPQALIRAGSGFDWDVPGVPLFGGQPPPKTAPDDVAFLTRLVRDLSGRYCVDPHRVYATGFSGGARMASQLACDASGTFAAVAPVSGLRLPSPCPATRPVPVLSFHGTADPVDPYNGNGQAYWTYSVPTAARRWAARDGCGPTPSTTSAAGYSLARYDGCSGGAAVELYTITGEGHEWPAGPYLPPALTGALGPQSGAVDANATLWAFFSAHPMP